jgi:hypothetical protein
LASNARSEQHSICLAGPRPSRRALVASAARALTVRLGDHVAPTGQTMSASIGQSAAAEAEAAAAAAVQHALAADSRLIFMVDVAKRTNVNEDQ